MRIQHNIMAMNSYRNYTNNTSALAKNLEKLSSGYKINRAGDDAAGLAISEKMRAQITGLQAAQKNVKDGVSLVKTAEGAMQEIQDMLNRMDYLATQSANGTYDNSVDRFNLQKEVTQLKSEINRIADSANFNGIKLLDGSLESGGITSVDVGGKVTVTSKAGTEGSSVTAAAIIATTGIDGLKNGGKLQMELTDDKGNIYKVSLTKGNNSLTDDATGKVYNLTSTSTQAEVEAALHGAINQATGGAYTASGGVAGGLTVKAVDKSAGTITAISARTVDELGAATNIAVTTTPTYAKAGEVVVDAATALEKASATAETAKAAIFTINGQKFVLAKTEAEIPAIKALVSEDVNVVWGAKLKDAAGQLSSATGLNVTASGDAVKISAKSGKGLNLQIGDTAEVFNRLTVSVKDMHTSSLGIAGIDIASQTGAAAAIGVIKNAINSVSSVRGDLGAYQNRLEHTQKNLSVMEENIQDAESTIRDTDVANEMMAYTKNNILIQSAQAMLAQANAVPQGVLQLLG